MFEQTRFEQPTTLQPRRDFLIKAAAVGLYAATYSTSAKAALPAGMPGQFPGRVVAVEGTGRSQEEVRLMLNRGITNLTGAPSLQHVKITGAADGGKTPRLSPGLMKRRFCRYERMVRFRGIFLTRT